jgi:hypothetical protein
MEANVRLYYDEVAMRVFRTALSIVVAISPAFATEMPTGFFRGSLLRWDGTTKTGTITAQNANGEFQCHYDKLSWLELEKHRVTPDKLIEGDPLEILADRHPGETTCWILTLKVLPPPPPPSRAKPKTAAVKPTPARATVVRHGMDNFAGVVTAINESTVTVHTRDGEETFHLRPDTRYIGNGLKMEHSDVTPNMRLSVEAGRNRGGEWEAFQLTWGSIVAP